MPRASASLRSNLCPNVGDGKTGDVYGSLVLIQSPVVPEMLFQSTKQRHKLGAIDCNGIESTWLQNETSMGIAWEEMSSEYLT